ncbi:MAG: HAMP domain-containing histidine kinase [Gemmatimonadaceae bacterium]|nr:HAMP domain-containing histidine kinase [Acetobacteraceae bacterium]
MFLWWATMGLLNGQVDAAIRADAQGLSERWREGGPAALLSTIQTRVSGNVDDDAIYLVLDPIGRTVAGNLGAWPVGVTRAGPIYELPIARRGRDSLARLHQFALPGGYALLVGRDVQARAALRMLLTDTLAWALLLIAALGVAGALTVQRMFRRMLCHVSVTAAAISAGDLSPRISLTGRGDEFDRLAATFNDMLDRTSRLMDGVRQVSNAIAHDLRTPITRARARLEDAAAHGASTAELRTAVGRAVADLDGVTAVFQALLRIAEIEAGARRSAFTTLDAGPLLADLAELYGAVAEERGMHLILQAEPSLPVYGDRELIQQAIANLLDNAVKFSPSGGVVMMRAWRDGAVLRVGVQDQGPGIPAADQARATERFYRGEDARHTPGFGLGLALVRAVAVLHGGRLTLSDASPGLCAMLTLPTADGEDPGDLSVEARTPGRKIGVLSH